jgi:hypothetical protein
MEGTMRQEAARLLRVLGIVHTREPRPGTCSCYYIRKPALLMLAIIFSKEAIQHVMNSGDEANDPHVVRDVSFYCLASPKPVFP